MLIDTTKHSIWSDIKASISGSEQDFTEIALGRAILILSIPMVIEMLLESVFAVVDIYFVSKLGAEAVATVGITESLITIIYAIAIGLSMSTTAIVSRRIGEKDTTGASKAAVQSILVAICTSLPLAFIGIFFASDLLGFMGAEELIIKEFSSYTSIMIGSNSVIMLLFVINAIFRGAGDASISLRVLWVSNFLNILLDPILIFGWWIFPELGIKGAALATVIGRGTGVIFQLYILIRNTSRIRILKEHLVIEWALIKNLIRVSIGGIFQWLIATSSWVILVKILSSYGSVVVAGYTIAIRIFVFSILPSWGMSNAAATLVGQNLGANKPERAEKTIWTVAGINMIFLSLVGITFHVLSDQLIRFFTTDIDVILVGVKCLKVVTYGYLSYAFGMVVMQAFNGAGDTKTPTLINFICFWLTEIPLAYFLAVYLGWAQEGVFYSIVIAETVLAVIGLILFRKGHWKKTKV